ncbi:MAG: hypothetical protein WCI29_12850 [Actinomycetes bacterium]|jgi:hypothetical protein
MFATVRRYDDVENPPEILRVATEIFVPVVRLHEGFVSYDWIDAGDGVVMTISVFESEAEAKASDIEAADLGAQYLSDLVHKKPQITEGIVRLHR